MRVPSHLSPFTIRRFSTHTRSPNPALRSPPPISPKPSPSIQSLAASGRLAAALRLLVLRRGRGRPVGPDGFVSVLRHCAAPETLMEGRRLHAHMVVSGFVHDPFVLNHLINMYGKCGLLADAHWVFKGMAKQNLHSWNTLLGCYCKFGFLIEARQLFDEMPKKDTVSWNTMISGYDQHGPCEEALLVFVRMRSSDSRVDHFGVSSIISACSNLRFLNNGRELHGCSSKLGLDSHVQVGSALIGLYGKCGELEDAGRVFDEMGVKEIFTWNSMLDAYICCSKMEDALTFFDKIPEKNVVSWTSVVAGCSQHERNGEAICYFHRMLKTGLRADKVLLVCALTACAGLMDSKKGFKIHALILKHGVGSDVIVGSVLVMLYARCGGFSEAIRIINHMPLVDDFSWSVLIAEYAKHGFIDSAIKLFDCLEKKSVPLWNALIGGYSELGMNEEAHKAFGKMQLEGKKGDEFTYGSLLLASDLVGLSYGEQLHSQTIKLGIDSSVFVGSALIDMYSYNFECEAAIRIFDVLDEPNLVCWNSLISGLGLNKLDGKALCALRLMMVFGLVPDNITLSLILDSCSNLRALREGVQIHTLASKLGLESGVVAGCALIDMYAKCDRIIYASRVFYELQDHSVITWTAIVGGYMRCGMWDEAKELFDIMPERNIVSWNAMISGCVKLGRCTEAFSSTIKCIIRVFYPIK
uniref:Pentatricopeptide repeat-containing protein n=1 Tax=Ananas comosus var. bracteatus TaxID=296719 RepID=A0A6V7QW09_ANACO